MDSHVERLLPLIEPVLAAIRVLRDAETRPDTVRAVLLEHVRTLRTCGEKSGIAAKDLDDAIYALVALADEAMLACPQLREAWLSSLLQMTLFRENTAGAGFYTRLDEIRRDPTRADVLLVYYLVLSLGFRGRFKTEDELRRLELLECVHLDLLRAGAASETALAPSVKRPRTSIAQRFEGRVVLACGATSVLLVTALWVAFALDLLFRVAAAAQA